MPSVEKCLETELVVRVVESAQEEVELVAAVAVVVLSVPLVGSMEGSTYPNVLVLGSDSLVCAGTYQNAVENVLLGFLWW